MTVAKFDVRQHHRERTRRAEARADMLERERAKLERLLALALQVAAGKEADPLVLLAVLERILESGEDVRTSSGPDADYDPFVELLRATDPDDRILGRLA